MKKLKITEKDLLKLASKSQYARRRIIEMAKLAVGDAFDENVPAMNQQNAEMMQQQSQGGDYYGNGVSPKAAVPLQGQEQMGGAPQEEPMPEAPVDNSPEAIGARAAQSFLGPEVMQMAASGDPVSIDLIARVAGQIAKSTAERVDESGAQGQAQPEIDPNTGMPIGAEQVAPPQQMTTPEEDLANEVVPQNQVQGGQAQGGQAQGGQMPQEGGNGEPNGSGQPEQGGQPNENRPPNDNGQKPKNGNNGFPPKKKENESKETTKESSYGGNVRSVDIDTVHKLIKLARAGKI